MIQLPTARTSSPRPRRQRHRLTETDLHYRQSLIALVPIVLLLLFVFAVLTMCILLNAPIWIPVLTVLIGTGGAGAMLRPFYTALPNIGRPK